MKDYLNISCAKDITDKKDRILFRLFEIIPGALVLGTLLGVFVFSWFRPSWVAVFMICFSFYYLLRVLYFTIHQVVAYFKIRKGLKIDWMAKLKTEKRGGWERVRHLVILPAYREEGRIIRESINALIVADYPKEKIIVVLTVEERAGKVFREAAARIEEDYRGRFLKFLTLFHPDKIPGEIAGKGSNVAWAGEKAKEVIDRLKIHYDNLLVSSFDIDTKVYRQYFSCLTWHYMKEKSPRKASYQPIPIYNNNVWRVPFFSRIVSTSNTFWQMIMQERSEKMATYSSHAIPGSVFFEAGYPNNVVCDDSRVFWRAYLRYDGNYRVAPMHYPVSMDAVESPNFFRTALNQYRQQRRWAWGVAEVPYVMFGFLKNKNISPWKKVGHLYNLIDGYWSWATAALLLLILGWLPIILGGEKFNVTILSFNLPILSGRIMTAALTGMIVSAILSTLLLPPLPKEMNGLKKITIFFQWVFLPITLIIFGSLPAIDAQIRLMLGKYMGFWVTEKMRK